MLIRHLKKVSDADNNMSPSNLGIVFGPTLLRSNDDPSCMFSLMDTVHQTRVVELIIALADEIFPPWISMTRAAHMCVKTSLELTKMSGKTNRNLDFYNSKILRYNYLTTFTLGPSVIENTVLETYFLHIRWVFQDFLCTECLGNKLLRLSNSTNFTSTSSSAFTKKYLAK